MHITKKIRCRFSTNFSVQSRICQLDDGDGGLSSLRDAHENVQTQFNCTAANMGLKPPMCLEINGRKIQSHVCMESDSQSGHIQEYGHGLTCQTTFMVNLLRSDNRHSVLCVCGCDTENEKRSKAAELNVLCEYPSLIHLNVQS